MQEFIEKFVQPHFNYWAYVIIMMIGLWAVIGKRNLIKKLIGISIFQTAIILFYVSIGMKEGGTIPIYHPPHADHADGLDHGTHGSHKKKIHKPEAADYENPLPHVLMLTAIVVGVSTLGVALAVAQSIFKDFDTLEEDEILEKIKSGSYHD